MVASNWREQSGAADLFYVLGIDCTVLFLSGNLLNHLIRFMHPLAPSQLAASPAQPILAQLAFDLVS